MAPRKVTSQSTHDSTSPPWGLPPPLPSSSTSRLKAEVNLGTSLKRQRRDSSATMFSADDFGEMAMGGGDAGGVRPLAITCQPCRSRKIKCDSKKPVCDNCSKNPSECYYPVKLKPGLRPGTGTDMTKRLDDLEERCRFYEMRLADHENRLNSLTTPSNLYASTPNLSLPNLSLNQTLHQPSLSDILDPGPSTSNSLPDLSHIPDLSTSTFDFIPPTSNSFGPSASPSGLSTTSFTDPHVLPPADIVSDLINLFYTHIHPWAPILTPIPPSPTMTDPPYSILIHSIVVVTLRLSNDPRLEGRKEGYKRAAKSHVLSHAIESTSLSSVQALALLALDLIGSDQGPSSWGILALLTRSAVHLGLTSEDDTPNQNNSTSTSTIHNLFGGGGGGGAGGGGGVGGGGMGGSGYGTKPPAPSLSRTSIIPPAADWREDECRRRLFWLIFALDRYACVSTGWDFALPDFDIKRRLPCSDEIWSQNEWFSAPIFRPIPHILQHPDQTILSPFARLVEALDLLGRAHTLQSQVIDPGDARAVDRRRDASVTLSSAARRWFAGTGGGVSGVGALRLMIHGIYHATLLKLNAYYAFPALSNGDPIEPYTSTCLSSARAIVQLSQEAREMGFGASSTPFFIWSCWVGARVLFVHAFLSHKTQPDRDFDEVVGALKEQAQYWSLANQYVKLLERAKRKWLAATSTSTTNSSSSLHDAIHVLLDLRRTAYGAVTGQPEATPYGTPPDVNLSHLPAWAVQPLLGDLHSWFDLPAGLFGDGM